MKTITLILALIFSSNVLAQDYVVCESQADSYRFCPARTGRGAEVELVSRYSKSRCEQGYSWGVTRKGIWVDRGCRARFKVYTRTYGYDYGHGYGGGGYGYGGGRGHDYHEYDRYEQERERLREEKRRLKQERRQLEIEKQRIRTQEINQCPAGATVGRCSDSDRRRGCKDWKENGVTPCKSFN